jgi:mannose-6-phosphate isomerase
MAQAQEKPQITAMPATACMSGIASTELRPWGSFTILEEAPGYKIKRIEVKPGHRLSLQMHHHRSEHWVVVSGTAKVTCGDQEEMIYTNQSTYVPPCTSHRLENPGVIPLVLIEVQNGEYLGEDDIVRFQDDYARAAAKK